MRSVIVAGNASVPLIALDAMALAAACSISRCAFTPTILRNLRMLMLKVSWSTTASLRDRCAAGACHCSPTGRCRSDSPVLPLAAGQVSYRGQSGFLHGRFLSRPTPAARGGTIQVGAPEPDALSGLPCPRGRTRPGLIWLRRAQNACSNLHFPTGAAMDPKQLEKVRSAKGFIAALDQSGGSTPKALSMYGIKPEQYSGDAQMFDLMHAMRTRIITSPAFNGDRVLGAILFEQTMDREIEGRGSADYLWSAKQVVPFLKVDKGLAEEADGVQLMKPMPGLAALLERAKAKGVFGTKMRSVVKHADARGIDAVADQQFAIGRQILAAGLMPIIEPEVDIHATDKEGAERLLKAAILRNLGTLGPQQQAMLKLTIPSVDDFYADLVEHPKVLRVVALSGGYSRDEANRRLARNHRVIASFSRALTEGLTAQHGEAQFNQALDASIASIYQASST